MFSLIFMGGYAYAYSSYIVLYCYAAGVRIVTCMLNKKSKIASMPQGSRLLGFK